MNPQKYGFDPLYHTSENFCPVVPENCRGQVDGARKERRIIIIIIIIIKIKIKIIIRNGAKTISLPNFAWEI